MLPVEKLKKVPEYAYVGARRKFAAENPGVPFPDDAVRFSLLYHR